MADGLEGEGDSVTVAMRRRVMEGPEGLGSSVIARVGERMRWRSQ